jgi:hypothetical protein
MGSTEAPPMFSFDRGALFQAMVSSSPQHGIPGEGHVIFGETQPVGDVRLILGVEVGCVAVVVVPSFVPNVSKSVRDPANAVRSGGRGELSDR